MQESPQYKSKADKIHTSLVNAQRRGRLEQELGSRLRDTEPPSEFKERASKAGAEQYFKERQLKDEELKARQSGKKSYTGWSPGKEQ